MKRSLLTTTIVGVAGEYDFKLCTPIHFQASIDWIQGVSGDFAAKSRLIDMSFKDKNDSSVVRTSSSLNAQLRENMSIQCNIFADVGNDKGVGEQLGATYTF